MDHIAYFIVDLFTIVLYCRRIKYIQGVLPAPVDHADTDDDDDDNINDNNNIIHNIDKNVTNITDDDNDDGVTSPSYIDSECG